jgi:hypothetical protein
MKTPKSESFAQRRRSMARWIREGGLSDQTVSQVHPTSVTFLADMNDLGYLTFNSQDARADKRTPEYVERSYVGGIMRTSHARKFVNAFNIATDYVASVVAPVTEGEYSQLLHTVDCILIGTPIGGHL